MAGALVLESGTTDFKSQPMRLRNYFFIYKIGFNVCTFQVCNGGGVSGTQSSCSTSRERRQENGSVSHYLLVSSVRTGSGGMRWMLMA